MKEQYPRHLGEPGKHRVLQYRDYPKRANWIVPEVLDYFYTHNIPCDRIMTEENSYVTDGAICFLTHGRKTNAYQLRYCPSRMRYNRMLRFDIPSGIDMDDHLYYTSVGKRAGIVIVEGSADALAAYSHGYTGISLLGANLTEARALMLKEVLAAFALACGQKYGNGAVFIPDNDSQGAKSIERMARYNVGVKVARLPLAAKDLCDLEYDEREQFLKEVLNG